MTMSGPEIAREPCGSFSTHPEESSVWGRTQNQFSNDQHVKMSELHPTIVHQAGRVASRGLSAAGHSKSDSDNVNVQDFWTLIHCGSNPFVSKLSNTSRWSLIAFPASCESLTSTLTMKGVPLMKSIQSRGPGKIPKSFVPQFPSPTKIVPL
jgi:hypothetical protein